MVTSSRAPVMIYAVELVKPIDYSPDYVVLISEHESLEEAVEAARRVDINKAVYYKSEVPYAKISVYGWGQERRPIYD